MGFGRGCCHGDSPPQTCAELGLVGCRGCPSPPNSRESDWKSSINAPSTTIRLFLPPLAPLIRGDIECSGTKGPVKISSAVLEQGLERRSDSGFVCKAELVKLIEYVVVVFDRFMCGFEVQGCHVKYLHLIRPVRSSHRQRAKAPL